MKDIQLNMVKERRSFLLEPGWKDLVPYDQLMRRTPTFMEDSAAGIVREGLQPGSLGLGALGPGNVIVVKERKNVRFKEEKKRLRKKPRETAKKIEVARDFSTGCVDVVGPCECVIDGDSQELEGANLFNLTAIDT